MTVASVSLACRSSPSGAALLLAPKLERLRHLVEVAGKRADLVVSAHFGAVAEVAGCQHGGVGAKLAQRTHDPAREQPGDAERQDERPGDDPGAPFQVPGQPCQRNAGRSADLHQPRDPLRRREAAHALGAARMHPARAVAAFAGRDAMGEVTPPDAAADRGCGASIARDDDAVVVDDGNDAACRQLELLERILEIAELDAGSQHRAKPAGLIVDWAGELDHPAPAASLQRIAEGEASPSSQDVLKIGLAGRRGARAAGGGG